MRIMRGWLSGLMVLGLAGCPQSSSQLVDPAMGPRIRALSIPVATVSPGSILAVSVDAQSPDNSRLAYRWLVTAGTLSNPSIPSTAWIAPVNPYGTDTQVTLTIKVIDEKGRQASQQATLMLLAK